MSISNDLTQQTTKEKDLSGKRLRTLSRTSFKEPELITKVDLQRNKLREIPAISCLSNLIELNLMRNEFVDFPVDIKWLHKLQKLYINQNIIRSIPDDVFPCLKQLQFLKLSTNRLSELPSDIKHCQSLQYLNLSNNNLKNVQPLVGLGKLQELYVENNRLMDLPEQLFDNLTMFKATGNPLRKPPEEVCVGGLKDIRTYFSMLRKSSSTIKSIKIMFLGSSMAGKSTLCRSFQAGRPVEVSEDNRTVGIDIEEVKKRDIRFLCWDFAGQEVYYLTHHVFITPQAFVILAIDLSSYDVNNQESFEERVSFWISNIQLRVPDSVVLPVGTHIDQCPNRQDIACKKKDIDTKLREMLENRRENLQQLKEELKNGENPSFSSDQMSDLNRLTNYNLKVLDLVLVDCTKCEDIQMFHDRTLREVADKENFPNIERTLPGIYQEVEERIHKLLNDDVIPKHGRVELPELLNDLNISLDPDDFKCILRYFHHIGLFVWYDDILPLKDTVFLSPRVLISLFKAIIRHDLVTQIQGITVKELRRIRVLNKERDTWVRDYEEKAVLCNVTMSILVRKELEAMNIDDADLIQEMVGTGNRPGNLLRILQHFEVCLPTKITSPLNPTAPEFHPNKPWESPNQNVYDPDSACMFPSYMKTNNVVIKMWGEDKLSDLKVRIYFLPEIPFGFFHRLVIKTCPLYPCHWVGRDQCCFRSGDNLTLIKERTENEDQFIEVRCKEPNTNGIKSTWQMVREIMCRMDVLAQEWPGLLIHIRSPCMEDRCSEDFPWKDWKDWLQPSKAAKTKSTQEEKVTCKNGHTRRTELVYPRALFD